MSEISDPQAWIARAEDDYLLARSALRRKSPLVYGVCFHAQQCAEKYLKALLIHRGQAFPKTHDLLALSDLCAKAGIAITINADELDVLSAYAVRVRYPGDDPSPKEAEEAFKIATAVRRFARRLLEVK